MQEWAQRMDSHGAALNLCGHRLGATEAERQKSGEAIAQALRSNETLRSLSLFGTHIASAAIQEGTRVLISLWDSLMFGRVLKSTTIF